MTRPHSLRSIAGVLQSSRYVLLLRATSPSASIGSDDLRQSKHSNRQPVKGTAAAFATAARTSGRRRRRRGGRRRCRNDYRRVNGHCVARRLTDAHQSVGKAARDVWRNAQLSGWESYIAAPRMPLNRISRLLSCWRALGTYRSVRVTQTRGAGAARKARWDEEMISADSLPASN